MKSTKALPADVVAELDAAVKEGGDEVLAHLYASVVAGPRRRVLGTFFTPSDEVATMLKMWDTTQPAPVTVVDVGAGVGVFTAQAARRWAQAHVTAVDVNPVTLGLLGARMSLPDINGDADRIHLVLEDFTTWLPSWSEGTGRLILGNPPYTRGQLITPKDRQRLLAACDGLCTSRASLSAFITALSLKHLGSDDGLCLLLPAQWLESSYAAGLRRHLLLADRRRVELRLAPAELFSDAVVDAVVLLVGTERADNQPFIVSDWEGTASHPVDRATAGDDGWRSWFDKKASAPRTAGSRKLSELAILRRGTATGANEFFCLSDDAVAEHALPTTALRPMIRRLSGFDTDDITDVEFQQLPSTERKWLLVVTERQAEGTAVAAYIRHGEDQGFDTRYLCQVRSGPWFDVNHDLVTPEVVITTMSRGDFHVVENSIGAAITNNLYGWRWRDDVEKSTRSRVLAWLRGPDGQAALKAICRSQGDGLAKVEPAALAGLGLPAALFE
ncbi:MAG TPA: methyltransferase [Candidatus Limnocylindria bacterium]